MNLDELERQMIREAQRELAPAAGVRDRHEARLLSTLARGAHPGSDTSGLRVIGGLLRAPAASWRLSSGSAARMLGVGLAVGALIGGVVGYSFGRRDQNAAQRGVMSAPNGAETAEGGVGAAGEPQGASLPEPSVPQPASSSAPPGTSVPQPSVERAVATAAVEAGASGGERAVKPLARAARRHDGSDGNAHDGNESSLAEEIAMLQRARRALAADNGRLALGIVEELDERFPKGVLIEERSATRVLALCKLERVQEARAVARDFLTRHPASVYAERVRTSCGAAPE